MSAPHLRHPLTAPNKNRANLPLSKGIFVVIDQEQSKQPASTIVYRDVRELDKERRRSHEVRRELPPTQFIHGRWTLVTYKPTPSHRKILQNGGPMFKGTPSCGQRT